MANDINVKKITTELALAMYDFDPDATTATDIAWVDMRDFKNIYFRFFRTVGTSNLTMKVLANAESDGSGTDVTVKTVTIASQPDAVADQIGVEISAEQIRTAGVEAGEDVRYVSLNLAFAAATDEGVVLYARGETMHAKEDLTADSVAT